ARRPSPRTSLRRRPPERLRLRSHGLLQREVFLASAASAGGRQLDGALATIRSPGYQFVDCRWGLGGPGEGRMLCLEEHIHGASFLDVDEDLADQSVEGEGRHPLPSAERFAERAGRAGIGDGVFVVAYGSMGGAERLWWLLRHFGHHDCAVLLGGIDSWLGPLSAGEEDVEGAVFTARERAGDSIAVEEIARRLGDAELVLVDARLAP